METDESLGGEAQSVESTAKMRADGAVPEQRGPSGIWNRRTFLKAAALGTAAAALIGKEGQGLHFGPSLAFANDLSTNPCTAEDVEIVGAGAVVNEPCACSGATFNATVRFTVRNNTSTGRYC